MLLQGSENASGKTVGNSLLTHLLAVIVADMMLSACRIDACMRQLQVHVSPAPLLLLLVYLADLQLLSTSDQQSV